jgi:hypothetical protein
MFMPKLMVLAVAALVGTQAGAAEPTAPAVAAAPTATAAAPAATVVASAAPAVPAKPKMICVTTPETGSLVKARKECGTAEEWKARQAGSRQQAIEMQTSRLETSQ